MSTETGKIVYNWLHNNQFKLFPGICIQCKKPTRRQRDLCRPCEIQLPRITNPCRQCGLALPENTSTLACGTCLVFPPLWSQVVAPYIYRPPVSGLITGMKFQAKLIYGRVLSDLLAEAIQKVYKTSALPDLVIPVPLHPRRVRQRGYNQALEIASRLSRQLDIKLETNVVSRCRHTQNQTGLSSKARAKNLRKAFKVKPDNSTIADQRIAIVDDVITTGVTAREITRQLLKAGANEVHVWALARTIL